MAKDKSFAAKMQKSLGDRPVANCPQCGETISAVQLITSERSPRGNSYKYNQRFVAVCKCNAKEILG